MKTAKVFTHGNSQAVRIPKEFRFAETEVYIEKAGDTGDPQAEKAGPLG